MGIQERKLRELENRRQLILDEAGELFNAKGFNEVTIEDIADKIEFSKGTIYSHFKSKEEIYALILLNHLNTLLVYLKEANSTCSDPTERIRYCLKAYLNFYQQHREYFRMLFFIDMMSKNYKVPDHLLKEIHSQKVACLVELQRVIKEGFKINRELSDFSDKEIALLLWAFINGIIHLTESNQIKEADMDKLVEIGFKIVTKGLK